MTRSSVHCGQAQRLAVVLPEPEDDSDTLESEEVSSCYGFTGYDFDFQYEEATHEAIHCNNARKEGESAALEAMDRFAFTAIDGGLNG